MDFSNEIINERFEPGQICNFYVKNINDPKRKYVIFVFLEVNIDL